MYAGMSEPTPHALGAVPIGCDGDPDAVLDQHCRVRGIDGLSVVDGSVIPVVPRVQRAGLECRNMTTSVSW